MQTLAKHDHRRRAAYDDDMVLWIDGQIQLLVEARYSELDVENLVGELDSMKNRESRALKNRLRVLMMHLLKMRLPAGVFYYILTFQAPASLKI